VTKVWWIAGASLGGLGVALGAFGAHALKSRLAPDMLTIFETGVRYQLVHALALLVIAVLYPQGSPFWMTVAGGSFLAGIILFSGTLYVLALTSITSWGMITPLGGLLLLAGWAALLIAAFRPPL